VRYFSPLVEVSFCGHATVAMAVAYAERQGEGRLVLETKAGEVAVDTHKAGKEFSATFVSVPPHVREVGEGDLDEAVAALGWQLAELDEHLPPRIANAGNDHLVLAVRTRDRLAELDYDFDRLAGLMAQRNWTTLQLVWQESADRYHSRNPAPSLGVLEDAATGAAAAAFGGYLRELALVTLPARVTITQGVDMGRPSTLLVDIPETVDSGISISGSATQII
jgi:PhzF family phenazine biosynthesis protein